MTTRPYTVLSCCVSLDGYLDDGTDTRLLLSNEADLDRVDEVRASCDAILVGATTIRNDDPRLLVRSAARRAARLRQGLAPSPLKVTVTHHAKLDASAQFFTASGADALVYCPEDSVERARARFGDLATVVDGGREVTMRGLSEDLHARGVRRLMVEGGGQVHTQFLTDDLADELQLAVAPFFVGDRLARRFVEEGRFPWNADNRATLAEVRAIGNVVLLRYALSARFADG
ncbi:Bifunctional deaminase-reductase domain protein [metagenome]|uniref:Bifunctional deaminase-reductase domain protein n=1 Tax=metagenome TaxID=256318 RepID=A0A2P2BZV3_9ZZZZ